jgi:glycine/D-amino acid oxidase-like deaminating enzyme
MMDKTIHIIGGGVVGLCSAWYLEKKDIRLLSLIREILEMGLLLEMQA